jgi:hypothetical protein
MKRSAFLLFIFLTGALAHCAAQAAPSATQHHLNITAGGMVSTFQPDEGANELVGLGTFVDVHFSHWAQIEAEGRWLRWNQYYGEHQDNYLIGPRVPIKQFGKFNLYGKALIGYGKMTFPFDYGYGTFTDLAFGGTLDYHLTRKITIRAGDFEYQYWPVWINNTSLAPYGFSAGIGYRVY